MKMVSGEAAKIFDLVPDEQFSLALATGLTLFNLPQSLQGQMAGGALLATQLALAVSSSGSSVETMLSAGSSAQEPLSRVVVVLQELASIFARTNAPAARGWAGGGGFGRDQGPPADEASCVRRSIESVGRSAVASERMQKLRAAVSTGVTTPAQDGQVLAMIHDLQMGEHGADVAMIMHQEKLGAVPTGALAMSAPAATVWAAAIDIRSWVARARERQLKLQLPAAVDVRALVASVSSGAFSIDKLVPGKLVGAERARSILVCWPAFVELTTSVHPRDATAGPILRQLAVEAFGGGTDEAAFNLLERMLRQAATAFEKYRGGSDSAPTWEAIRLEVRDELDSSSLTKRALEAASPASPQFPPAQPAPQPAPQAGEEADAAAAAVAARPGGRGRGKGKGASS